MIENSVVIGTAAIPTAIGRRTTFGHRCLVIGATVGDLCEIGNASILMPGARARRPGLPRRRNVVPAGMTLPDDVVAVGRPARVIRTASATTSSACAGYATATSRSRRPRPSPSNPPWRPAPWASSTPTAASCRRIAAIGALFPTAEITGDVVIGERTIIGAGVKIIGDSHGPVRIGNDVQILENTVLHLLPDNELIIDDGATIGPGAMIHGCHIGARPVIEPGAIVCDGSVSVPAASCAPAPWSSSAPASRTER